MSIFDQYDDEFTAKTQKISTLISHVASYETDAAQKREQLRNVEMLIVEAGEDLKLMDIEVRSTQDPSLKRELAGKMTSYKKTLAALRGDCQRTREKEDREGLLGGNGHEHMYAQGGGLSHEHRERLLQTTSRLDEQTQRIQDSRRTVLEIEDVAMEISSELGRNREKITGVHDKVKQTTSAVDEAKSVLDKMGGWFRNLS